MNPLLSIVLNLWFSIASCIELQPHQKIPSDFLLKHSDQKGVLLYHSLGSGKTFIALDYAEKNPSMSVVLFLPDFLKMNWLSQMKIFGVKDFSRYHIIGASESSHLLDLDLSNSIVVVDEIHRFIERLRTGSIDGSDLQIRVYDKLKGAKNLLILTGTPIYSDTSDIAYIANLLNQGEPEFSIDPMKFKTEYMSIKPVTQLFRGHVTESKLVYVSVPFWVTLGAVVGLTAAPLLIPLVALAGAAVVPVINELVPANQVSFREFNTEKWEDFSKRYISYYNVNLGENENYPNKIINSMTVNYNQDQTNFFLNFADESLNLDQLKVLLADSFLKTYRSPSDLYLKMHSSSIQRELLVNATSGRDIGNLEFMDSRGKITEAPKFLEILKLLQTKPGQVAIYSSYFENGIKRFAAFLNRQGLENSYIILDPSESAERQGEILDLYNQGKKRILLIHPEITEGISLQGTEQFHILEPLVSENLQEQIIGRAIRFRSHAHLPKEHQLVNVYLWEATVNYGAIGRFSKADQVRREHWQQKYSEVNVSAWSGGIHSLDRNYFLKDRSPDSRTKENSMAIAKDVVSFKRLLEGASIETHYSSQ